MRGRKVLLVIQEHKAGVSKLSIAAKLSRPSVTTERDLRSLAKRSLIVANRPGPGARWTITLRGRAALEGAHV